ncbi:alpha/beta fold hydrolase [Mangrovibacter phragmitis]|uniref:alpha/beta fold hydrolase n=1 Tax=Mangrovibacter phragmitis TaxID=1691903 RepID=UPI000A4D6C10|nr:alpha/beta hydrolase [Mangrovibacter phragmitis]
MYQHDTYRVDIQMVQLSHRRLSGDFANAAEATQGSGAQPALAQDMQTARLFSTDSGNGRALILLHGWVADSHDWSWQIPELEQHYRVIAVDLRGHGRSEVMPSGAYTPDHYAADIISLIQKALPGQKAVLIGHSMGGQIAARIASERPDLVDAVISVDGSLGFDQSFAPLFQQTAERLQREDPASVTSEMIQNFYDAATPAAFKTWHSRRMFGMPEAPFRESFGPLFVGPEQVGVGQGSEALLRSLNIPFYHMCRYVEQAIAMRPWFSHPKSKVDVWEHASHWIMKDRPDDVNAAIIDWLNKL